jgi:hypothetical protein
MFQWALGESKKGQSDLRMELNTRVNGLINNGMVSEYKLGQMVLDMKVFGKTVEHSELGSFNMVMVMYTKVNG